MCGVCWIHCCVKAWRGWTYHLVPLVRAQAAAAAAQRQVMRWSHSTGSPPLLWRAPQRHDVLLFAMQLHRDSFLVAHAHIFCDFRGAKCSQDAEFVFSPQRKQQPTAVWRRMVAPAGVYTHRFLTCSRGDDGCSAGQPATGEASCYSQEVSVCTSNGWGIQQNNALGQHGAPIVWWCTPGVIAAQHGCDDTEATQHIQTERNACGGTQRDGNRTSGGQFKQETESGLLLLRVEGRQAGHGHISVSGVGGGWQRLQQALRRRQNLRLRLHRPATQTMWLLALPHTPHTGQL